MGVANRTDYDLKSHSDASGSSHTYFDQASGEVHPVRDRAVRSVSRAR